MRYGIAELENYLTLDSRSVTQEYLTFQMDGKEFTTKTQ